MKKKKGHFFFSYPVFGACVEPHGSAAKEKKQTMRVMLTGYHELGTELRLETRYGSEESRRRLASNGDVWQTEEEKGSYGRPPLADTYRVLLFGKTEEGQSVLFDVDYWLTLVVQIPSVGKGREFAERLRARLERCGSFGGFKYAIRRFKPTAGFFPDLAVQPGDPPRIGTKPFLFVWVKNLRMYFIARKIAREALANGVHLVESSVPQTLRLLQQIGAEPGGIVQADTKEMVEKRTERYSNCDLEYRCFSLRPWPDSKPPPFRPCRGADRIFPLRIMSFDIETYSEDGFPDSPELDDRVISICTTILDTGTGKKTKTVHGLHNYTPIREAGIVYQKHFATEAELLESWSDFLKTVDIVVQYNGDGYDWPFVMKRAKTVCGPFSRFWYCSRLIHYRSSLITSEFSSSAFGDSQSHRPDLPGITNVDVLTWVKRNKKFKDNRLKNVAQKLLGEGKENTKVDLPIKEMNACYVSRDPDRMSRIHEYCLRDTDLPLRIFMSQHILEACVEMAKVTYVFPKDLFERGSSFKVLSQLFVFARDRGHVLDALPDFSAINGYEGAMVFDMDTGYHRDVHVLDFKSMYPSTIMAKNLCYTSWVSDTKFLGLPGYTYFTQKTAMGEFTFQQTIQGLLPQMCTTLGERRVAAKKRMKAAGKAGDTKRVAILNARQLGLKVAMNSIYGFTGAAKLGKYPCPPVAASTTAYGRWLLQETRRAIETQHPRSVCVYGDTDSVMFKFPWLPATEEGYRAGVKLAEAAAHHVTAMFPEAIVLEYENTFRQGIFISKKHYVTNAQESPDQPPKRYVKGVPPVRRDFCTFQQKTYSRVVDALLQTGEAAAGLRVLEQAIRGLIEGKVPLEDLVLTKSLKGQYKADLVTCPKRTVFGGGRVGCGAQFSWRDCVVLPGGDGEKGKEGEQEGWSDKKRRRMVLRYICSPAELRRRLKRVRCPRCGQVFEVKVQRLMQRVVADKIEIRAPGTGPKKGDRVRFLPVWGSAKAGAYEKMESVEFVQDSSSKAKLDAKYYIDSFRNTKELFEAFKAEGEHARLLLGSGRVATRIASGARTIYHGDNKRRGGPVSLMAPAAALKKKKTRGKKSVSAAQRAHAAKQFAMFRT